MNTYLNISLPPITMFQIKNFHPRPYQVNISNQAINFNTLAVLPTGLGKTKLAILTSINRLNNIPNSKILICAPTKPLSSQIHKELIDFTDIPEQRISLLTGTLKPDKRKQLWDLSFVIIATPQTIQKDIENKRISLKDISLLVLDECHRSRDNYATTILADNLIKNSKSPRILALTASPGSSKEKIEQICKNLFIEKIEIRTEDDEDLQEFLQKKDITWINVDLPLEYKEIHKLIGELYKEKLSSLHNFGLTKPISIINKKDLLSMQFILRKQIPQNKAAFWGISILSQCIKLNHMLELLETQGLIPLKTFIEKLKTETTKASKAILSSAKIQKIELDIINLQQKGIKHPKINKLKEIIQEELNKEKNAKIIVFANFRDTVKEITDELNSSNIKAERFVGQADRSYKGLKQSEQAEILKNFKESKFQVLVASSVAEEGIDINEVKAVIFFEAVPSELRRVQRMGRTARTKPGKVIFLLTKDTRDEAYYWSALRKEKKMKSTLLSMQKEIEKQQTLT